MMNESREFEVELELKARVTMQDIDDIMCTALDAALLAGAEPQSPLERGLGSTPTSRLRVAALLCSTMPRAATSGS